MRKPLRTFVRSLRNATGTRSTFVGPELSSSRHACSRETRGCPAFLLNIAGRSLPRLTLRGGGLASKDAVS
jgi:hypothetical protein